jgi:site-specific DNA recombinase
MSATTPRRSKEKPTSAVIYVRVSTEGQAISGAGLEAQLRACRQHAERLDLPVLSEHQDAGYSGKMLLHDRPGLCDAVNALRAKPGSILIVHSLSRLGRSQKLIWDLLDDTGEYALPLTSATEPFETVTPMGRAMLGMLAVWAQLEADMCSERTIAALAAVARRGVKLGRLTFIESRGPDGFRYVDPEKVETIRFIQGLRNQTGMSYANLATKLNAEGLRTPNGCKWHNRTVRIACLMQLPTKDIVDVDN